MITIGSVCSGYGGLDMAIESFFGARTKWFSEFEAAPSKVLAAHWPDVPNLGDMTKIDWAAVPKVDIVAGGTPCQDLSGAGKRKGMTEGTRSNLWVQMREAVAVIRPSIVIWENVRGAFSAYASSEVESEPGLLGAYGPDRPALRALGRVLGDLSDLGYDTEWVGVRASDAGAPHGRFRVFVLAYAAGRGCDGRAQNPQRVAVGRTPATGSGGDTAADTGCERFGEHAGESSAEEARPGSGDLADGVGGLRPDQDWGPAVGSQRYRGIGGLDDRASQDRPSEVLQELRSKDGTQAVQRSTGGSDPLPGAEELLASVRQQPRGSLEGHESLASAPLPESRMRGVRRVHGSARASHRPESREQRPGEPYDALREPSSEAPLARGPREADGESASTDWGPYELAIRRWELVLGRSAPSPTEPTGRDGAQRLSPTFVEFMMGLPTGWVTAPSIRLSRTERLKALGNGVVPQQAELALSILWPRVLELLERAA